MTIRARSRTAPALAAVLLGACASQTGDIAPSISPVAETVTRLPPASGYQMKPEELALDCRTLTGRMAVRIVQIRDYHTRSQATVLSRGMQTVSKPAWGGSGEGTDPGARYARDRAMLEAYNHRLAEKNCANFDLDAELDPNAKEPPRTRPLKKS
ncbi:hypothetical protein [Hyphomicrobium sp.]|uniref:hypothetical protein n=1 Tax=Hyphomicrobium sp. TaxID=82 RepID=UPI0025BE4C55|nr:hypothetical protein [Hyphomicrobium sp.]MCC7250369.1 hypothetical protein [Hyphomicrobium sp.]